MTSTSINPRTIHTNERRAAAEARQEANAALSRLLQLCRNLDGSGNGEAAQLFADATQLAGLLEGVAHKAIGARFSAAQKAGA